MNDADFSQHSSDKNHSKENEPSKTLLGIPQLPEVTTKNITKYKIKFEACRQMMEF